MAAGRADAALADFDAALALAPGAPGAWAGKAAAETAMGNLDEAIEHYGQALAIDGSYAGAYMGRAEAKAAGGDGTAAYQDRVEAFRIDPTLKSVVDRPGGWRLDNRLTLADLPIS